MKIIKFYAWENAIEARVKDLRNKELKLQLRYKLWNVVSRDDAKDGSYHMALYLL